VSREAMKKEVEGILQEGMPFMVLALLLSRFCNTHQPTPSMTTPATPCMEHTQIPHDAALFPDVAPRFMEPPRQGVRGVWAIAKHAAHRVGCCLGTIVPPSPGSVSPFVPCTQSLRVGNGTICYAHHVGHLGERDQGLVLTMLPGRQQ